MLKSAIQFDVLDSGWLTKLSIRRCCRLMKRSKLGGKKRGRINCEASSTYLAVWLEVKKSLEQDMNVLDNWMIS
ncbi:hypothetical protein Leryth_004180 [Lithospermum erythrorhizon]|nr:hypothetical protein Leryth_004180 [Lithospermum erythrorhizon]